MSNNLTNTDTIEQLCDIYENNNIFWWRKAFNNRDLTRGYIFHLIDRKNIFWLKCNKNIVAVCEIWMINNDLMGRIIDDEEIFIEKEDTMCGDIAYIVNLWIDNDFRNNGAMDVLRQHLKTLYGNQANVVSWHRRKNASVKLKSFNITKYGVNYGKR